MENKTQKKTDQLRGNTRTHTIRFFLGGWIDAFNDFRRAVYEPVSAAEKPMVMWIQVVLGIVITWFLYVPVHELLHVAGCVVSGGTVTELVMGREYGADILKHVFPFITPQSSMYAGRVTGFEPNGDFGYLLTVFLPFILTIFPGVWFLKMAIKKKKIWMTGPGAVMGLAPFINLTGDYFEMGTIVSTRLVNIVGGGVPVKLIGDFAATPPKSFFNLLRSDDIFRLFKEMADASPEIYGLNSVTGILIVGAVIGLGGVLAIVFSGWTYTAGILATKIFSDAGQDPV